MIVKKDSDATLWYVRLGHIEQDRMTRLPRECFMGSLTQV